MRSDHLDRPSTQLRVVVVVVVVVGVVRRVIDELQRGEGENE